VALASLRATLWREQAQEVPNATPEVTQYRDFSHLMEQPAYGASNRA
jgi:hypothetical protein